MSIPDLKIPRSSVAISRLGFGCGRIFGGRELKSSQKLIEAALAAGIRHFDTAPSYGNGQSEAALGALLAGVPNVTIATKIGSARRVTPSSWAQTSYRRFARPLLARFPETKARLMAMLRRDLIVAVPTHREPRQLRCDEVVRELEDSLTQLKRCRIDLYLLHEPDQFEVTEELKTLFADLQHEGTIGAFGLAWGGVADPAIGFGTVCQERYETGAPQRSDPNAVRIFHGVLRQSGHDGSLGWRSACAGDRIRTVLGHYPDAAVVFSASHPTQINEIASLSRQDNNVA